MTATSITFDRTELAPGVTLHVNSSSKRKTNLLTFAWVADLGAAVTGRALLSSLLTHSTANSPDMRALTRRQEMLYGTSLIGDVIKVGEKHVIVFRLEFPNDHFLPGGKSLLPEVVELLAEVLQRPLLESGRFPAAVVEGEKALHERLIAGLLNNKGAYAVERCIQEMCAEEEFRRYEYGSLEGLAQLTPESLTDLWRRDLRDAPAHVYFSGDVEPDAVRAALAVLGEGREGAPRSLRERSALRTPGEVRTVSESLPLNQTKLVLGFRTATRFGDSDLEALVLGNGILGLFPHSKLFQNVREKASLCYYATSTLERSHGLMLISSGVEHAKKEQALELIQKQLEDVQQGEFSDEDLQATVRAFDNRLTMLEDSPGALMDIDLTWRLAGIDYDHAAYRERLSRISRDEIIEAMKKVELDTIYVLHPQEEAG